MASFMGSQGLTGSIETTALAALVFQRAGVQPELANGALAYLLKNKDSFGTWHNTQATVLSLKALIQSVRGSGEKVNASVTITLNGGQAKTIQVTPQNFDVVQLISFDDVRPGADNKVEIKTEGQGSLMYQVAGSYYLPWSVLGKYPDLVPAQDAVTIDVKYDRTQLAVNDTVNVTVSVQLNQKGARAELGPGRPRPAARFYRAERGPGCAGRQLPGQSQGFRRRLDPALRADPAPDLGLPGQPGRRPAAQLQLPPARPLPAGCAQPGLQRLRLLQPVRLWGEDPPGNCGTVSLDINTRAGSGFTRAGPGVKLKIRIKKAARTSAGHAK